MKQEKNFEKLYQEYLEKVEEEKRSGKIPAKTKPLTFNEFLPDSYKY